MFRTTRNIVGLSILSTGLAASCIQPAFSNGASDGQWYVGYLNIEAANVLSVGQNIIVGVVDTGVDRSHESLRDRVLPGADFSQGTTNSTGNGWTDVDGHGTGMASLIVGRGRVRGIAPGARILPVKVKQDSSKGGAAQVATGINWAIDNGARVISVSLGSAVNDPRLIAAVNNAKGHDVVIVASVGNAPESSVQYPARYPGVLAVASIDRTGNHASTSVVGAEVTVCAPGERLSVAGSNGGYVLASGTSGATAITAGVVALIRSLAPNLKANDVVALMASTALDRGAPGRDPLYGYGIIDASRSLVAALAFKSSSTMAVTEAQPSLSRQDGEGDESGPSWALIAVLVVTLLLGSVATAIAASRRVH